MPKLHAIALIKVVTHLDRFRQESKFTSWVYRVAANHLLTTRKRLAESRSASFEDFEAFLEKEVAVGWRETIPEAERSLVVREVMLSCTQGMLLCLDRSHRITYILSEIFDVSSTQGAYILDISPAAYRKRLSRARERIQTFMIRNCGLVKPDNLCHCDRMASYAIQSKEIDPDHLVFAEHRRRGERDTVSMEHLQELDSLQRIVAVFRSHPEYAAPDTYLKSLKELINGGRVSLFE